MKHKKIKQIKISSININKLESGYTVKVSAFIDEHFKESYHAVSTTKQLLKRLTKALNK